MHSTSLCDLPDYPAIRQIQESLWGRGEIRGAAVMVGAGFSRFSELDSDTGRMPPLWSTFQAEMAAQLYPGEQREFDALKLAEEYRAALGQHALDALIRKMVPDEQWSPGNLHKRLLSLPWADVLTTNWDTLLERTSLPDPDSRYEVVRTPSDIGRTRPPRIVKLHGSLPSHTPFIFTEEDFRTYPRKFAPFVNLAQQVLLENELCLLGFSGDDPNFLQWAGWVRDQLGSSARPIRLVGVLKLSPSRRKVFEQHNITPVDLAPLVNGLEAAQAHKKAMTIFLDALKSAKPRPVHKWIRASLDNSPPENISESALVEKVLESWVSDRKSYPGWLVAPTHDRMFVRMDTSRWYREFKKAVPLVEAPLRVSALAELVWRHSVSLWPLDDFLRSALNDVWANGEESLLGLGERKNVLISLLVDARINRKWDDFEGWSEKLKAVEYRDDLVDVNYQAALKYLSEFDFPSLSEVVSKIVGDDPIWALRQASLYSALKEHDKAGACIKRAYRDIIKRRSRDSSSLWLLSREAWAAWLFELSSFTSSSEEDDFLKSDSWPVKYKIAQCDPWDELFGFDQKIAEAQAQRLKESVVVRPSYDAGYYRDSSDSNRIVNGNSITPYDELKLLGETVGLPRKIHNTIVMEDRVTRTIEVLRKRSERHIWGAAGNLHYSEGLIDLVFSRVEVARLPLSLVVGMSERLRDSINFGISRLADRNIDWVGEVRDFLELLSRLVIRFDPVMAGEYFRWGKQLAEDKGVRHWWLFESLGKLLARSLEAIPQIDRKDYAFDMLEFPLPSEKKIDGIERTWPELAENFITKDFSYRDQDPRWGYRINQLIQIVAAGDKQNRTRAVLRLLPLARADVLTHDEKISLSQAIWSRRETSNGFPANLDVYAHAFLDCPCDPPELSLEVFHRLIIRKLAEGEVSENILLAIEGATSGFSDYKINSHDALDILDVLLAWEPSVEAPESFFRYEHLSNKEIQEGIGKCIARTVLPVLDQLDDVRLMRLVSFLEAGDNPTIILSAYQISRLAPDLSSKINSLVRRGLASHQEIHVTFAIFAIEEYVKGYVAGGEKVPSVYMSDIASICAVRREPGLLNALWLAKELLVANLLAEGEQERIVEALDFLKIELDYKFWNAADPRTKVLSLTRRSCVQLASVFRARGSNERSILDWVEIGSLDPFPEVRFSNDLELEV